jgi:hypothetical protein
MILPSTPLKHKPFPIMAKQIFHLRPRNPKNIRESLAVIESATSRKMVVLHKPGDDFDQHMAILEKAPGKSFRLTYKTGMTALWNGALKESFILESTPFDLLAPRLDFRHAPNQEIAAKLSTLTTTSFDERQPAFFRLILPVKEELDFRFYIDFIGFQAIGHNSVNCVRIELKGLTLDAYYYETREVERFFMLDAVEETTYEAFSDLCFAVLIAIGYVTGQFIQDEGYYFTYDNNTLTNPIGFRFMRLRPSVRASYTPIYANAAGFLWNNLPEAKKVQPTLRPLTASEFTRICQWAADSLEFRALLLLTLEGTAASLTIMPSAFSVALEAMTALLVKKDEGKYSPITDKTLAKQIRAQLKKEIDQHAAALGPVSTKILKAKIDDINQPTNRAKLTKPFEVLKFKLTEADIEVIDHRNDFLHGSIAYLPEKDEDSDLQPQDPTDGSKEIFYTALRLYTLIAVLVLKSVEYDSRIVNYPAVHLKNYPNIKNYDLVKDEPFFRQV